MNTNSITKTSRGQYEITPYGKQQFLRLEKKQSQSALAQPRLCVMAIVNQHGRFVVIRRRQQPFIGIAEWPAATVSSGEQMTDVLQELLHTRLGIAAEPVLLGFFRRIDVYDDMVFDDKLFAIHTCELATNTVIQKNSRFGDNIWIAADELATLQKPARALHDIYMFSQAALPYQERRYPLVLEDIVPAD